MKLDTSRTVRVGFAFLSICAFWQLYDNVVPLILKFTFNIPDGPSGIVMSLDNILALFLLPLLHDIDSNNRVLFLHDAEEAERAGIQSDVLYLFHDHHLMAILAGCTAIFYEKAHQKRDSRCA